jgi:hypothetical protein
LKTPRYAAAEYLVNRGPLGLLAIEYVASDWAVALPPIGLVLPVMAELRNSTAERPLEWTLLGLFVNGLPALSPIGLGRVIGLGPLVGEGRP